MKPGILFFAVALKLCISASAFTASQSSQSGDGIPHHHSPLFHRDAHVPAAEKNALFAEAGIPKSDRKYYRVDHKVPLELGGSKDRANLQLQTKPEAKAKDRIEHYLIERVRRGDITIDEAREMIVDWKHVNRY